MSIEHEKSCTGPAPGHQSCHCQPLVDRAQFRGNSNTIEIHAGDGHVVLCTAASTIVEIDKLYGPLVACGVRVRLDYGPGEWVVEREQWYRTPGGDELAWVEVVRWDCQLGLPE